MFRTDRYEASFVRLVMVPRQDERKSIQCSMSRLNRSGLHIWVLSHVKKPFIMGNQILYREAKQNKVLTRRRKKCDFTRMTWVEWGISESCFLLLWRTICLPMCHYSVLFTLLPFEGRCKLSYGKLFWLACWEGDVIAKIIKSFCHISHHSPTGEAEFSSHKRTLPGLCDCAPRSLAKAAQELSFNTWKK